MSAAGVYYDGRGRLRWRGRMPTATVSAVIAAGGQVAVTINGETRLFPQGSGTRYGLPTAWAEDVAVIIVGDGEIRSRSAVFVLENGKYRLAPFHVRARVVGWHDTLCRRALDVLRDNPERESRLGRFLTREAAEVAARSEAEHVDGYLVIREIDGELPKPTAP